MDAHGGHESVYPRPATAWWGVALFTFGAILSYTDRQILAILVDPIRASLHLTDTQLSLLQGAAFAVLYSVLGLPLGRVADLVPRRALLALAIAVWSVGTAMGVFLTGIVVGAGAAIGIGGGLLQLAEAHSLRALPALGALSPWRMVLLVVGIAGFVMSAAMLTLHEPAGRNFSPSVLRARFPLLVIVATGGILGIPVGILGTGDETLASACCWIFVSSAIGTIALATILDLLPQESRGFGTSTVAFTNIIVGMGLGPTLVALVTDRIFHDSQAVGYAMSCIIAPSVLIAVLLYAVAMLHASQLRAPSQSLP